MERERPRSRPYDAALTQPIRQVMPHAEHAFKVERETENAMNTWWAEMDGKLQRQLEEVYLRKFGKKLYMFAPTH